MAWILLVFVLLNGLLCSVGHGQMLAGERLSPIPMDDMDICGDEALHGPAETASEAGHASLMPLAMFDCLFAGKVIGALALIAALTWRRRVRDSARRLPAAPAPIAARHGFPGLAPQAP